MAHNVKIKYYPRENSQMGTHSFYAQPIPNGTYGFEEICKQAHKNTSIETHTIRAAVEEYMKVAWRNFVTASVWRLVHSSSHVHQALMQR